MRGISIDEKLAWHTTLNRKANINQLRADPSIYSGTSPARREAMASNTVLFEVRNNVAYVTLNRPQANNSFDLETAKVLADVSLECERARDVRAVLIRGAGNTFSAGGDVKAFAAQ